MLTTKLPRFALPLLLFFVWAPAAYAWSWPVQGPVLQPFSYDSAHPYAAGQHRGVDIGASAAGDTVVAPAGGTVSFAGTVPTSGRSLTIQTTDGYSVTLTHLGTTLVAKGETVAERDPVGTIGPSGTPELDGPYVHLGVRVTSDPNGYLDPLGFLPPAATSGGTDGSTPAQPGAGSGSSTATGGVPGSSTGSSSPSESRPAGSNAGSGHASTARTKSRASGSEPRRIDESRSDARQDRSSRRPAVPRGKPEPHTVRLATPHRRADAPMSSWRRPVVEPAASAEPTGLGAGHEIRWSPPVAQLPRAVRQTPTALLPLVLNGAAALVAVGAAVITASNRRRRRGGASPVAAALVLHLRRQPVDARPASRAA